MNDLIKTGSVTLEPGLLANLERHAGQARGAHASNTERALRADVVVFTAWCAERGNPSLPAAPETLAAFVDAMGEIKATATVRRYVSSVATFHRAAQLASPAAAIEVKLALKRLHRAKGRAQVQAAPLTRHLVERMLAASGTGMIDLRNRALLAVSYDSLCRRSELVALERGDFEAAPGGDGTVTVRRSKPISKGKVRCATSPRIQCAIWRLGWRLRASPRGHSSVPSAKPARSAGPSMPAT